MTKTLRSFRNNHLTQNENDKSIAIIGMTCRFPESESIEEYWKTLCEGKSCVKELSSNHANSRFFNNLPKKGGFLKDIDLFDPEFFSIPSHEAVDIDPLKRQVLLSISKLLENAGYTLENIRGKSVGIFIGARSATYSEKFSSFSRNSVIGLGQNFIAAYAAQVFDLHGPNLVVDSACSSFLLSVHLARQSLNSGECDIVIAGGWTFC